MLNNHMYGLLGSVRWLVFCWLFLSRHCLVTTYSAVPAIWQQILCIIYYFNRILRRTSGQWIGDRVSGVDP